MARKIGTEIVSHELRDVAPAAGERQYRRRDESIALCVWAAVTVDVALGGAPVDEVSSSPQAAISARKRSSDGVTRLRS